MSTMSQLPAMRLYWSSRSPFVRKAMIAAHETGVASRIETLDYLEADASALTRDHFNIGHLAIGCALGYLDFRYADDDWRRGHSGLAEWHKGFVERASVKQTAHANVY
jgi:glutathione S-transferase